MDDYKLSDFGVEELNTNKSTNINGGAFPWGPFIPIALAIEENWDEIKKGYNEEMNSDG